MKILALEQETPGMSASVFQPYLKAEAEHLWQLYQQGTVRELYFRQGRSLAVLVLECDDSKTAQQILATLPLVAAGLITFEVVPLQPYPGFARLFEKD